MLFACIYVPCFPVEALVRSSPELREESVAVVDGRPPLLHVVAANERARAAGIDAGMTRVQAAELPGLVIRQRSPAREEAAHAALLDCGHAFSPRVEATAADMVVLDLAGLERVFGSAQKIARDLARLVYEVGLEAHVAVAGNPEAAIHAARGFPGVTVIPPGKEAERLGGLPVEVLMPPLAVLETLDSWGVRTFRALGALPELAVSERLGQAGLHLQKLARGGDARPLQPVEAGLHFEETMELEDAVELLEPLSFILARLLDQLCARLGARSLAANQLEMELQLDRQEDLQVSHLGEDRGDDRGDDREKETPPDLHRRTLRLPVPMRDSKIFLKLLQLDLKSHPPEAPVVKVRIAAAPVRPRVTQQGLFLPLAPEPERLELTLARIAAVVGDAGDMSDGSEARVGAAELVDTHRPGAFRVTRFHPPVASDVAPLLPRPEQVARLGLRVFRPPWRTRVELREAVPVRVFLHHAWAEVAAHAGPWRNSGEWWSEHHWQRDEWDVAVHVAVKSLSKADLPIEALAVYRIYRNLADEKWWVEGCYD